MLTDLEQAKAVVDALNQVHAFDNNHHGAGVLWIWDGNCGAYYSKDGSGGSRTAPSQHTLEDARSFYTWHEVAVPAWFRGRH